MQRVLEKLAQKLNSYDEASLMQLWQHYATRVAEFEPSKRWEEAALALCLIQAMHWKNQLFNYNLVLSAHPPDKEDLPPLPSFLRTADANADTEDPEDEERRATVLAFPSRGKDGARDDGEDGGEPD